MTKAKQPDHAKPTINFFIVGAPKCGTTSLFHWFSQHPDICVPHSAYKEPHYWGSDLIWREGPPYFRTQENYWQLFESCRPNQIKGEASTWYLRSRRAAQEIAVYNPKAKIIIMLRNPVDVMHALHSQNLYNGTETKTDFEAALAAGARRQTVNDLPTNAGMLQALQYLDAVRFAPQIERYVNAFGWPQIEIVLLPSLKANPKAVLRRLFAFLEVDSTFVPPDMSVLNTNKQIHNYKIQRFLRQRSLPFHFLLHRIIPLRWRLHIVSWLKNLNSYPQTRPPMSQATRQRLQKALRADVDAVTKLIGQEWVSW